MSALLLGLLFALQSLLMPVRAEAPVLLSLEDIEFSTSQRRAALQAQTRLPSSRLRHLAASSDPDLLAPGADNLPLLALQDSQPLSGARLGRHVAEQLRQAGDRLLNPLSDPQQLAGLLEQSRAGGADLSGRLNHLGEQALQSMVDSGLNQVEQRLQGRVVRRVELGYRSSFGGREELFQADLQLSLWEQERRAALFGQLGALTRDGEGGANVGVGYRHLVSGGLLLGLNAFYDYLSDPSVQRWSVGGELKGSLLDLSGNWYQGQGDESTGNVEQYSPDGWDLELAGRLPRFPWVEAGARYYHWDGEGADEDLEGVRYRVLLKPFSLFGLGVEYDDPERGSEDWGVEAEFSYQFGQSMKKQLDPLQFTRTDPWGRRYERVKREYEIRVRSRTIAATVAELDADELTVDPGTGTAAPGRQSASEDVPSPVVVNVPLRLPGAVAGSGAGTLQQTVRVLLEGTATPGRSGAPVPEADYLLSATAADASGVAASVSIEPSTGTPQSVDVEFGPSQQVLILVLTLDLQSDGEAEGEESVELRVQGAAEALAVLGITDSVGPGASISASTPSPLTEETLNGATLTVTLTGTEYELSLNAAQFTLSTTVPGVVTVSTVSRTDATNAELMLAYDGSDFDTTAMLGVTVADAAHTGTGDLTTDTVPVTAVVESNNAQLSALVLSQGALTPNFTSGTTTYTATVVSTLSSLTVTPTAADVGASIAVDGTTVGSGTASGPITLITGANLIAVVVTAADGSTMTYTVTVTRMTAPGAAAATISASTPSALTEENLNTARLTVTLTDTAYEPSLNAAQFTLSTTVSGVTVSAVSRTDATNAELTLTYDGSDFDTTAMLVVTVADAAHTGTGNLNTDAVTVTAVVESNNAQLSALVLSESTTLVPTFVSATTTYTATVANSVSSLTVTPTAADAGASITVNTTAVGSGVASGPITLDEGLNSIAVVVTAADGSTMLTYTVAVTRMTAPGVPTAAITANTPNSLSESNLNTATLTITLTNTEYAEASTLSPGQFTLNTAVPGVTVSLISVSVGDTTNAVLTLTYDGSDFDTNATLGVTVAAAAHTGAGDLTTGTVTVTAVAESSNAQLSALVLLESTTPVPLTPAFTSATPTYTAMVANSVSELTVTPTAADAGASITVNTVMVASGVASGPVTLNVGGNPIAVVVTAADGSTMTYTVTVTRMTAPGAPTAAISASTPSALSEANLNTATLTVTLTNTAYENSLNATQFTLVTAVLGVTVNTVDRTDGTNAVLTLAYDGSDFDDDAMLVVTVADAAHTGSGNLNTDAVTVTAVAESNNAQLSALVLSDSTTLVPTFVSATTTYTATVANSVSSLTVTPTAADAGASITVNTTAVGSGVASGPITLDEGLNSIAVVVTAADGSTMLTYTVAVTRMTAPGVPTAAITANTPNSLSESNLNTATLTVTLTNTEYAEASTLSPGQFTLNTTVPGVMVSLISVSVGDTTNAVLTLAYDGSDFDTNATLGVTVAAAAHTGAGDLTTGTVTVTAVAESSNAQLSALVLLESTTPVPLTPNFSSATPSYTAMVANSVSELTVTPTAADAGASITVNTVMVASGVASGPVTLNVGGNPIAVVVTAADGSTMTYTVTVTRMTAPGAPTAAITASNPSALSEANLNTATLTVTLTNTAYENSLNAAQFTLVTAVLGVTVNTVDRTDGTNAVLTLAYDGSDFDDDAMLVVTVADAAHTGSGNLNTDAVTVTAVAESSNAQLSALVLSESTTLVPTFVSATTSYTAMVANSVSSLTVTPTAADAGASITVNTTPVVSGMASGPVTLNVGPNPIAVEVTAADGSTMTYTVTVTRAGAAPGVATAAITASNPDSLTERTLNGATLTITLTGTEYASAPSAAQFTLATSVSGVTVMSVSRTDATNAVLTLAYGGDNFDADTDLSVTVTAAAHAGAEDLVTSEVTVRAVDESVALSALLLSQGTALDPAFDSTVTSYTATVPNSVMSLTVTPTAVTAASTSITVNTVTVVSGAESNPITLAEGETTITVVVTASTGGATMTYTVTVTRLTTPPPISVIASVRSAPGSSPNLLESAGDSSEVQVRLSNAPDRAVDVNLQFQRTPAENADGFQLSSEVSGSFVNGVRAASIRFGPTDTVQTFQVTATEDDGDTISESLTISLVAATGGEYQVAADPGERALVLMFADDDVGGSGLCASEPNARAAGVRAGILAALGVAASDCSTVSASSLAELSTLDLSSRSITQLRAQDLAGLSALTSLDLSGNANLELSVGILDSFLDTLTDLTLTATPYQAAAVVSIGAPSNPSIAMTVGNQAIFPITIARQGDATPLLPGDIILFYTVEGAGFSDVTDGRAPRILPIEAGQSAAELRLASSATGTMTVTLTAVQVLAGVVIADSTLQEALVQVSGTSATATQTVNSTASIAATVALATGSTETIAEAGGSSMVEVSLSQAPSASDSVTVGVRVQRSPLDDDSFTVTASGGTAGTFNDQGEMTVSFTFTSSTATNPTLTFTGTEDNADSDDEQIRVILEEGTGYTVSDPRLLTLTLQDNDQSLGLCESENRNGMARTPAVRAAILAALSVGTEACATVTAGQLAGISALGPAEFPDRTTAMELRSGDFAGLSGLVTLDLSELSVAGSLPVDLFSGLSALTTLSFGAGSLSSLPGALFSGLSALTTLDLSDNGLVSLPGALFSGLSALTTLDLSNNGLVSLPVELFSGLSALTTLDLAGAQLSGTALTDGLSLDVLEPILGRLTSLTLPDSYAPAPLLLTALTPVVTTGGLAIFELRPDTAARPALLTEVEVSYEVSGTGIDGGPDSMRLPAGTGARRIQLVPRSAGTLMVSVTTVSVPGVSAGIAAELIQTASQPMAEVVVNGDELTPEASLSPMGAVMLNEGGEQRVRVSVLGAPARVVPEDPPSIMYLEISTPAQDGDGYSISAVHAADDSATIDSMVPAALRAQQVAEEDQQRNPAVRQLFVTASFADPSVSNELDLVIQAPQDNDAVNEIITVRVLSNPGDRAYFVDADSFLVVEIIDDDTATSSLGLCAADPDARAEQVRFAIFASLGTDAAGCSAVTMGQLQGITALDLSNTGLGDVRPADFANLDGLTTLDLSENTGLDLSPGVLDALLDTLMTLELAGTRYEEQVPVLALVVLPQGGSVGEQLEVAVILTDGNGEVRTVPGAVEAAYTVTNMGGTQVDAGNVRIEAGESSGTIRYTPMDADQGALTVALVRGDANTLFLAGAQTTQVSGSLIAGVAPPTRSGVTTSSLVVVNFGGRTVVRRAARLSALELSAGTLVPNFDSATTSYTVRVDDSVANLTITPTAVNPADTSIAVGGAPVDSGMASNPRNLVSGASVSIRVRVTASDGSTFTDYHVQASRVTSPFAVISASAPDSLTETNLDGATLTITLGNTAYESSLSANQFGLRNTAIDVPGVTVMSVDRTDATNAVLTLAYDGSDFETTATLFVTVLGTALSGPGNLQTGAVTVTPEDDPSQIAVQVLAEDAQPELSFRSFASPLAVEGGGILGELQLPLTEALQMRCGPVTTGPAGEMVVNNACPNPPLVHYRLVGGSGLDAEDVASGRGGTDGASLVGPVLTASLIQQRLSDSGDPLLFAEVGPIFLRNDGQVEGAESLRVQLLPYPYLAAAIYRLPANPVVDWVTIQDSLRLVVGDGLLTGTEGGAPAQVSIGLNRELNPAFEDRVEAQIRITPGPATGAYSVSAGGTALVADTTTVPGSGIYTVELSASSVLTITPTSDTTATGSRSLALALQSSVQVEPISLPPGGPSLPAYIFAGELVAASDVSLPSVMLIDDD